MSQTGAFSFFGTNDRYRTDGKSNKFNLKTLFDFSNL